MPFVRHHVASVAEVNLRIVAREHDRGDLRQKIWEELVDFCIGHLDKHILGQVLELSIRLGENVGQLMCI